MWRWGEIRIRTNIEIDEASVTAIMDRYGVRTKTEAVDLALRSLAGQPIRVAAVIGIDLEDACVAS